MLVVLQISLQMAQFPVVSGVVTAIDESIVLSHFKNGWVVVSHEAVPPESTADARHRDSRMTIA